MRQLLLALPVADLGITLVHYASHRLPLLWRLHAVHHSVTRMYGFNGLMKHPLHQAAEAVGGVLPLAHVNSRLFGNALTGLPFAVYGGAVADDEATAHALEAEARWVTRSATGVDTALLMHHRQFMHKIHHALEFQNGVLGDRQRHIDNAQEQVHAAERDLAGLRKFAERKQQAIDHKAQRQDQKYTDEMALSIHLRHQLAQAQARN